jgi:hypothetical protein
MNKDEVIEKLESRVKPDILVCPFEKLIPFQENLVELHDIDAVKLKEAIKTAWIDPFKVWVDPDGKINILDGHQRQRILSKGKYTGNVQCIQIECVDKKEAAFFVLLYRSVYGKMTDQGLYEYLESFELDYSKLKPVIDLQDFNMGTFEVGFYKDIVPAELESPDVSELTGGSSESEKKDGNWFYIEYYGRDDVYEKIKKKLEMINEHQVDPEFFEKLINEKL